MPDVDVIVVGAGPAGACAALTLARAGRSVILLERGPFPGSKNMYGGVVYPRVLDSLLPNWWEEAPIQRWVTRRSTMMMTPTQALTIDYRTDAWGRPPYNGADGLPARLRQLAGRQGRGRGRRSWSARPPSPGCCRDGDRGCVGVRTDRPDGELTADVVIACDGVNSFLAKEAGLYGEVDAANYTLGVKETLALPEGRHRRALRRARAATASTSRSSAAPAASTAAASSTPTSTRSRVGVVLKLPALAAQSTRPEEIIAGLKAHPAIAPLVEGGELKEYSAHVIPEAGWSMMPTLGGDGMLVAGDAAALCLAAGIWLEGVNFAMASGMYAGARGRRRALDRGRHVGGRARRLPAAGWSDVRAADHKQAARASRTSCSSDRVQHAVPGDGARTSSSGCSASTTRTPKPGLRRILQRGAQAGRCAAARPRPGRLARLAGVRMSRPAGDGAGPRSSFEDRMATAEFDVARTRPHHRRRRRLPRVHDQAVRRRLPGQPVRADRRRRHPLQLRAVLRVRHVLPRVQHRRAPSPGPTPRAATASSSGAPDDDHRRVPQVGRPAARGRPVRHRAPRRPLRRRVSRRPGGARVGVARRRGVGRPVLAVTVGPAAAEPVLRDALAAGAATATRVDLPIGAPSDVVAASPRWRRCSTRCARRSVRRPLARPGPGSVPAFLAAHLDVAQALGLVAVELGPPGSRRPRRAASTEAARERLRLASPGRLLGRGLHGPPTPGVPGRRCSAARAGTPSPSHPGLAGYAHCRTAIMHVRPYRPRARALAPPRTARRRPGSA